MSFVGHDQQPLLRGIIRALVIRKHFPKAIIEYGLHDGDVVGREKSGPQKWINHNGGWVSWVHEFPWTPLLPIYEQKTLEALVRKGFPAPAIRLEGEGVGVLLGEADFELIHLEGLRREIEWAVRMGGEERQAEALLMFATGMLRRRVRDTVQAIANYILENSGYESIQIGSLREFLSGPLELEQFADRLPADWRWAQGERLGGLPRTHYLLIEMAQRGQIFATNLSYWGEVAEVARNLNINLPPYKSIRFAVLPPPIEYAKIVPQKEFPKLHENGQSAAWCARWSTRPSLIFAYLTGTLRQVVETATIL